MISILDYTHSPCTNWFIGPRKSQTSWLLSFFQRGDSVDELGSLLGGILVWAFILSKFFDGLEAEQLGQ